MYDTDGLERKKRTNSSEISLTEKQSIGATATVELDGRPPSEIWADLASSDGFRDTLETSVRELVDDIGPRQHSGVLCWDYGITALDGAYARMVANLAQDDASEYREKAYTLTEQFGQDGNSVLGWSIELEDVATGPAAIFRESVETPQLAFAIGLEFQEQRSDQRRAICDVITSLADGCDVTIVADKDTQQWLLEQHRSDLPVNAECNVQHELGPLSERVDEALSELNPDGREPKVLRTLSDESTGALSYHSIYSAFRVDKSRIRQCINRLENLGLVNTFGPQNGRKVELLEAGREYLSKVSHQITLDDTPPNTYQQTRGTHRTGQEGKDGQLYQTTVQGYSDKVAANAVGLDNDVCLVAEAIEIDGTAKDRKNKAVDYDPTTETATVSVRATGALQLMVSVATALATPWFVERTFSDSRLEKIDEPATILREGRNIGGLSEPALNDSQKLRNTLIEWGKILENLTTDLNHANGDDKTAIGSEIMKQSHGLAGSIVHLLDAAGIDIIREIRLAGDLPLKKLDQLSESIGRSALIQSKYGAFSPYRHIFETDAGKPLISPTVDATDPVGSLIGSFVIRGKDIHRLREPLEAALSSPGEFLDEQPDFTIPVKVRETDRPEFATTVTRMLKSKNLRPTREAVSIVHALTGSPYDAAKALNQLKTEDTVRDVRPDELRYGLRTLEAERILPNQNATVGKVVHALLNATEPLSQATLADRAGVSTQSIRNNRDVLEALDLVSIERGAWRLNLSFRTTEERRNAVVPEFVTETFTDAVDSLLEAILPPERYGDPDDPVGGTLFWPPEPWILLDNSDLAPWVKLAARLTGTERPDNETTVSVGTVQQTAIAETSEAIA